MDILTRSGSLRASVNPSDSSKCIRSVMQAGRLELHFSSSKPIPFALGDYADFEGDRYTLCYPSEVSKVQREWLEYTLVLHSSAEELKQRLVKSPEGETKVDFVMVGSPTDHLRLITRAMGEGWSVGTSLEAGDRLVAYKSDTCYAALCRLAEEYKTEWVVKGKTISLRREELWRDAPVAMSYGRGKGFLSGVSRSGDGDKLPISRLYVVGGSRNIDPAAYGSRSLHLPDGSTSLSSGVEGREAALDLSHIYPSRVGTISEVVTVSEEKCFYDIKDASIPADLNYSDCRIPGEQAVIRFQSGALAGRELEIRQSETALEGYHHEERRFELVPREEDGFTFPSPQWMPKAGDKYAVFGISLPPTYIKEAEERMLSEAKRYLEDNKEPLYTFRGEVDGIWARKHWLEVGGKLVPGGHVLFSDPEFHPKGTVIRIVSTTQAVNDPHAPSVTLSTAPVPGSFLSRLDRVEADEVVRREQIREVQRQQSQSYRQALEHLSMVDRAVEGLEGFTRRLKPSVLETMGILVGSQATQLDFVREITSLESVTPAINYDPDDKALHIGESVLRHQTIGITTVKDRRDPSEYRYWRLPEYVSPPLTDPDRSYYIYARAARVGTEGAFLLSEEPIPMESDPDYFHLLIGTLSSLDGGDRAYNRLYGFSMISPGQMVVDTISSANGRMSIDLAQGKIYASSVSFSRPDGSRGSLSDLAGEVDELQSHPPKIVDGKWHVWDGKAQTYVNTGDTARGETGANGLAPKILDGKWSVWDGSRWVSTGVPAQGPKGEQGAPGKDGAPGKKGDKGEKGDGLEIIDTRNDNQPPSWYRSKYAHTTVKEFKIQSTIGIPSAWRSGTYCTLETTVRWGDSSGGRVEQSTTLDDGTQLRRVGTADDTDWEPWINLSKEIAAAKEQATKAQQSTDSLKGYVDGAFRDGIVDDAEAKAIKTYINEVDAQWQSALGAYEKVYTNSLLTGTAKTALADAKITLAGKVSDLTQYIATAIGDGRATPAEVDVVNSRYNAYKGALRDFQRALKTAEESIRDAGKTTGGRNLLLGTTKPDRRKGGYSVYKLATPVTEPGKYILSFDVEVIKPPFGGSYCIIFGYRTTLQKFEYAKYVEGATHYEVPIDVKRITQEGWADEAADIYLYPNTGFENPAKTPDSGETIFSRVKLERGTVATDWTPAPEDVQAEIDRERAAREEAVREVATGLSSATTLIRSLEQAQDLKLDRDEMPEIGYLLAALKKPNGTQVAGGLLLSNQIILSDAEDDIISATLSGQRAKGAKSLRLGIDYTDGRDAGTEQTALCNDGTGHLGELYFGGEEIGFGATDSRYMQIGGSARSESEMVNASTEIHKSQVPGTTVYKAGETLLDNFYLPGSNSELKYTAMISARADAEAQRRIVVEGGGPDGNPHYGGGYERPERVVYYDRCYVTTSAYLRVTITRGGEVVYSATSPTVTASAVATGGRLTDESELTADKMFDSGSQEQAVTLTVPANIIRPNDFAKLTLVCSELRADRGGRGSASAGNIVSYLPYDTSKPMVAVTMDKAAFFYGRGSYILLNYIRDAVLKVVGNMLLQGNLTLKGDLTADSIICKSGGLYSGGVINEYGTMTRWVGRKITVWKVSTGRYKLSHSLGHINYVVQAIPVHSSDNNCFVIDGTETAHTVEVGVQWNSSWTNRAIHFVIYAQQ